jgi:hypothetical protein
MRYQGGLSSETFYRHTQKFFSIGHKTMSTPELGFEVQTFQIRRRFFLSVCTLFAENVQLLTKPHRVRSRASEAHFRLFLEAVEEATTENATNFESRSGEFQFIELERRFGEFVSQHFHFNLIPLKSAIADLQRRSAGRDREFYPLAESTGRAKAKQDLRLEGLRGAIGEVEKKQQHERAKVSGLQEVNGEVQHQIGRSNEAVGRRFGPLERAEVTGRTLQVESNVASLRAAMADDNAKLEEVQREVAGQNVLLPECCPKVNLDLRNLDREHVKLKEELRVLKRQREPLVPPAGAIVVSAAPAHRKSLNCRGSSPPPETPALPGLAKQFPSSVRKVRILDVPGRTIAHLTRECSGNIPKHRVIDVTCGVFERETDGAMFRTKDAADLETGSVFWSDFRYYCEDIHSSHFISAYRERKEDIPHMRDSWMCHNFRERRILPTHYRMRPLEAIADVRNVLGQVGTRLQDVVEENGRCMSAASEMRQSKEQRRAVVGGLNLRGEMMEQDDWACSEAKELCPQTREALGISNDLGKLVAVVGLRGGSRAMGRLSARGLANVAARDWSHDFTFIIGDYRYWYPSSVAQFLSPRVSNLHWIDATISELRLEVDDRDKLFGSVLEIVGSGCTAVDSAHQATFAGICTALCNPELYKSVCGQVNGDVAVENVVDRLRFSSAIRCDISTELEFIASHFYDFLCRPDLLKRLPFSLIHEIIGHESLRLETEDSLYEFISENTEMNRGVVSLMEFVRFEYCSTKVMNNFSDIFLEHLHEFNVSILKSLCARLVLSGAIRERFPPSVKKGGRFEVPDGIIAHLTREYGGNMHDRKVVAVTVGSLERTTEKLKDDPKCVVPQTGDNGFSTEFSFYSGEFIFRQSIEAIVPMRIGSS